MRKKRTREEKKLMRRFFLAVKIFAFFAAVYVFAVIGLILPLRPTMSVLEKRNLEEFPTFTMASFWDGSYFEGISTWYADTFPFREKLIAANDKFKSLYGLRGEQIIFAETDTEEVAADTATTADILTTEEVVAGSIEDTDTEETAAALDPYGEDYVDAAIDLEPEQVGDVYITGDTGFSLFYTYYPSADAYIEMLDKAAARLDGIANVYSIVAPNAIGINLSDQMQRKLHSDDQKEYIDYIYSGVDSSVTTIETYDVLKAHNSEYIYFRTDHHWTALGAYYVYCEYCAAKGFTPTPIDEYETMEFPDFLGTVYPASNQAEALAANPDTVIAYIPQSTNDMTIWNTESGEFHWNIIADASGYASIDKYSTFIGDDQPYEEIDNPLLNDGSACLVIKDSYGSAFVPFLVDHYDHVYVVDFRKFDTYPVYNNSVYDLVVDKGIDDVIILNYTKQILESTSAKMSAMFD